MKRNSDLTMFWGRIIDAVVVAVSFHCGNEMAGRYMNCIYISRNKYKGGLKMQAERNHNEGL